MRILVFGAGVIGRIYAARLSAAGHEVSVLSRGATAGRLRQGGVHLAREGAADIRATPHVLETLAGAGRFDLALVAVRLDQLEAALDPLASLDAGAVASFVNLPLGTDLLLRTIGAEAFVPAFPGVAGRLDEDGTVRYIQVAQQPTVIGPGHAGDVAKAALRSAGFPLAATANMDAWLKTHAVFIAAFESALAAASGDAISLASDRAAVSELVRAVRDGLTKLHGLGVPILPAALRIIFLRMPHWFATRYWAKQLAGDLGTLALAPHAVASQHSELPVLQEGVRSLLGGAAPERLERLFGQRRLPPQVTS